MVNEKEPKYQITGSLCLGEFGKLEDLSAYKEIDLFAKIQSFFLSPSEEVRSAASIGLGKITVGNMFFYLDKVMKMIQQSDSKQSYLYLNAIREIVLNNSEALHTDVEVLTELLLSQASN